MQNISLDCVQWIIQFAHIMLISICIDTRKHSSEEANIFPEQFRCQIQDLANLLKIYKCIILNVHIIFFVKLHLRINVF